MEADYFCQAVRNLNVESKAQGIKGSVLCLISSLSGILKQLYVYKQMDGPGGRCGYGWQVCQHFPTPDKGRVLHCYRLVKIVPASTFQICRASLRESSISDRGIKYLLRHRLRELDIHNCASITVGILAGNKRDQENDNWKAHVAV